MTSRQFGFINYWIMTVLEFNPRFNNDNNWSCGSVDHNNCWCLAISDCIDHYMNRFYDIPCYIKECIWPLSKYQFECEWNAPYRKGFKTFEEYMASDPEVEYEEYEDCQFYALVDTDDTLTFAFQDDTYVFVVHIDEWFPYTDYDYPFGFGCVINKTNNELHFVALGEDDGNYWADHEIDKNILTNYDLSIVTSIVNEMNEKLFWSKEALIENLFKLAKEKTY